MKYDPKWSDSELFNELCAQTLDGVPGVLRITNGNPGSTNAVFVGSHGKEIRSGISLVRYILGHPDDLADDLDLLVVVGNLEAARMALATDDPKVWKQYRYTPSGRDMNRMPSSAADLPDEGDNSAVYELRRAAALRRVLLPLKIVNLADWHATDQPSMPSGLGIVGDLEVTRRLFAAMPLAQVILDVVEVQRNYGTKTQTLSSIVEPKLSVEIEVGQTGSATAAANAILLFIAWGRFVGIVKPMKTYCAVGSVMALNEEGKPDKSFKVVNESLLKDLTPVEQGEVLLQTPDGRQVKSPCKGKLTWGPDSTELSDTDVTSEVFWVLEEE